MSATCRTCGEPIELRSRAGTEDVQLWFHDQGKSAEPRWRRVCGFAEPLEGQQEAFAGDLSEFQGQRRVSGRLEGGQ